MKTNHLGTLCSLLWLLVLANAQQYKGLIRSEQSPRPIYYNQRGRVQLDNRFTQFTSNQPQDVRTASTQISQGSEKFSFEMFTVSIL